VKNVIGREDSKQSIDIQYNYFIFLPIEVVSKARHSALDAESPEKKSLIIRGLRVKPAMTVCSFWAFDTASFSNKIDYLIKKI
jgi:hypothetical protein